MLKLQEHHGVTCVEGMVTGPVSRVFVFLVDGMIVDTGPQSLSDGLRDFYATTEFDKVVLTHGHEDHVGNAAFIRNTMGVPIYLHESGISTCAKPAHYPEYRRRLWGYRDSFQALPLGDEVETAKGRWEVIHTPGHAVDHVALRNPETGVLFSGDLFLGLKVRVLMPDESIPTLMNSLRDVLRRDFDVLFCGHAGFVKDGRDKLARKLHFLEEMSGEIWRLHEAGYREGEIDAQLFPYKPAIIEISNHEYDTLNIVRSVLRG